MELPGALRAGVDALLQGVALAELRSDASRLSERYRGEVRDGRLHLDADRAVRAYLATRMPATFSAVSAAMVQSARGAPAFAPLHQLDVGAGPGTAWWAARDVWPSIAHATLLEASAAARTIGAHLLPEAARGAVTWIACDARHDLVASHPADLVTLCYVLDEIEPRDVGDLIDILWSKAAGMLLVVEPGTPAGWQRILAVRDRLIAQGAHVVAPCPHHAPCPLASPDWCHFARRVARSRLHRLAKDGDVPWEDEKFAYVALAREPGIGNRSRVLAPPRVAKGQVVLKLCGPDGRAGSHVFRKRDSEPYRRARRTNWGEPLMPVNQIDVQERGAEG